MGGHGLTTISSSPASPVPDAASGAMRSPVPDKSTELRLQPRCSEGTTFAVSTTRSSEGLIRGTYPS